MRQIAARLPSRWLAFAIIACGWNLPAQSANAWRSWGAQDGLPESFVNSIAADPAGTIWSIHGSSGISRMDGYSVDTGIPALRYPRKLLWTSDGVWAVDRGGLRRLRGHDWDWHPVDQLKEVDPVSPPALRVLSPGRLLIVANQWIAVYETATRRSATVLRYLGKGMMVEPLQRTAKILRPYSDRSTIRQ